MKSTTAAVLFAVSLASAQQASKYSDPATGIDFLGYTEAGVTVGIALPTSPKSDAIIQLRSDNITKAGGWVGLDFGTQMVGPMLLVAWPGSKSGSVMVSPRVAKGYESGNGAMPYTANKVTISPIATGTVSNSSVFMSTFVCEGCLNKDTFTASDATNTFAWAVSLKKVNDADNKDTHMNDHSNWPFGSFKATIKDAQSDKYDTWAKMANGGSGSSGSGDAAKSSAAPSSPAASSAAPSGTGNAAPASSAEAPASSSGAAAAAPAETGSAGSSGPGQLGGGGAAPKCVCQCTW